MSEKFHHYSVKKEGSTWIFYSSNLKVLTIDYDGQVRFKSDVTFDYYDLGLIRKFITTNVESMKPL